MSLDSAHAVRWMVRLGALAALALTLGLSIEGFRTARAQQRMAQSVLDGYARLAAERFADNVRATFDYGWAYPVFSAWPVDGGASPSPGARVRTQSGEVALSDLVVSFFELANELGFREQGESPLLDARAREALRVAANRLDREGWYHSMVLIEDGGAGSGAASARIFFVAAPREDTSIDVRVFEAPPEYLPVAFGAAWEREPVLPQVLTDGTDSRSLVSLAVTLPSGVSIFSAGPPTMPTGSDASSRLELEERWGGLVVESTIPPRSATHLALGGAPRDRSLVVLMLGLSAAAAALALLWALRRERQLMRVRERFVTGASHELRTPLAQIRLAAETLRLRRVRSNDEVLRYVETLDRESRRLSMLVDNLLEFSRDDERQSRLVRVGVEGLLREVCESFAPIAREREAELACPACERAEGLVAFADPDLLRQVLYNLLDNATKYGPPGQTVRLDARLESAVGSDVAAGEEHGVAWLEIAVTDQGPGVDPDHRELVWQRFWRAPGNPTTGFGIGLAVVRELARRQGGEVGVDAATDDERGGARFTVRLRSADVPQDRFRRETA